MNVVEFKIENKSGGFTTIKNVALPIKYGKLLDEQLDYATVDLVRVRKESFPLFAKAIIDVTSETEEKQTTSGTYFIANDNAYETPVGSGCFNHTLTLIELTKYLECFPLENLCFTNPHGNTIERGYTSDLVVNDDIVDNGQAQKLFTYKSAVAAPISTSFHIPNIFSFLDDRVYLKDKKVVPDYDGRPISPKIIVTVDENNSQEFDVSEDGSIEGNPIIDIENFDPQKQNGVVRIRIVAAIQATYEDKGSDEAVLCTVDFTVSIPISQAYLPLKPWTIKEVIDRVLECVEPQRRGDVNRGVQKFKFEIPKGKENVFNAFAPEFTFTGMNLREALQTIGGYIHAEPRLTANNYIEFDFYGENKLATYKNYKTGAEKPLNEYKYRTYQGAQSLEQACNTLDSYMQNLVNRINGESTPTVQPYQSGGQSFRAETSSIRLGENEETIFNTKYPIDSVLKFEVYAEDVWHDITPYVYESNVYQWLSSYTTVYPYSKSYGLSFTQGEKNVKGFFYKPPDAVSSAKKNYAITNIINRVTGKDKDSYNYMTLQFRLSYVPIYSTRIRQSKQHVNDWLKLPRTINYSQSSNSVEASFFGEHVKGTVERLGNVEKTVVMNIRNAKNIPAPGMLWDNEYYISSVMVEVQHDLFIVECGLTKNFNRISKYIGANSYKRVYEVSEKMVQERHSVYTDYIIFTSTDTRYSVSYKDRIFIGPYGLFSFFQISQAGEYVGSYTEGEEKTQISKIISAVMLRGESKSPDNAQSFNTVLLPVVAAAFGNVMEFTWEYEDNYSAGSSSTYKKSKDVSGYFSQPVEYGDYYGRVYWQHFSLLNEYYMQEFTKTEEDNISISPLALPYVDTDSFPTYEKYVAGTMRPGMDVNPVLLRKDSREKIKGTYCIELLTDVPSFVIGSALASRNPLVFNDSKRPAAHLYILKTPINKFATHVDLSSENAYDLGIADWRWVSEEYRIFNQYGKYANGNTGKAWCYAIPPYQGKSYQVQNESGVVEMVTTSEGGWLLFGENVEVKGTEYVGKFQAFVVADVFDYLKRKESETNAEEWEGENGGDIKGKGSIPSIDSGENDGDSESGGGESGGGDSESGGDSGVTPPDGEGGGTTAPTEYTITFYRRDIKEEVDKITTKNQRISNIPSAIERTGYEWYGWIINSTSQEKLTPNTVFTKYTTVYAHWTPLNSWELTVEFYVDGTEYPEYPSEKTDRYGMLSLLPSVEKDGYEFKGWEIRSSTTIIKANESLCPYMSNYLDKSVLKVDAKFVKKEITFKLYKNEPNSTKYNEHDAITVEKKEIPKLPVLDNTTYYTFVGWSTIKNDASKIVKEGEEIWYDWGDKISLYSVWAEKNKKCVVYFENVYLDDDGNIKSYGDIKDPVVLKNGILYKESFPEKPTTPLYYNTAYLYKFICWTIKETYKGVEHEQAVDIFAEVSKYISPNSQGYYEVHLVARWEKVSNVEVTFVWVDPYGKTLDENYYTTNVENGLMDEGDFPSHPADEDYWFGGWKTNSGVTVEIGTDVSVLATDYMLTVYSFWWAEPKRELAWEVDDGDVTLIGGGDDLLEDIGDYYAFVLNDATAVGAVTIGAHAFSFGQDGKWNELAPSIQYLIITASSIEYIQEDAFYGQQIVFMEIMATLKYIASTAFDGNYVDYMYVQFSGGTKASFLSITGISKDAGATFAKDTKEVVVNCSDGGLRFEYGVLQEVK